VRPVKYKYIGMALVVLVLAAIALGSVMLLRGGGATPVARSTSNAALPGVTQADLTNVGIYTVTTAEGLQPSVSAADALPAVLAHEGNGITVLNSQLVQLSNAQYHNLLAWAVSLDPLSAPNFKPSAGPPNGCHFVVDGPASFVLTFVDATSGKWVMELQKTRMKSLASPPCPVSPAPSVSPTAS
jgi:hypothetical protein